MKTIQTIGELNAAIEVRLESGPQTLMGLYDCVRGRGVSQFDLVGAVRQLVEAKRITKDTRGIYVLYSIQEAKR